MNINRITRKESKPARNFADLIFYELRKGLKNKYIFDVKLVGSAKWNAILRKENGYWDLDYQILLTNNSREYIDNKLSYPDNIKNDFVNFFKSHYQAPNYEVIERRLAITLVDLVNKYSFDFVIIKDNSKAVKTDNGKSEWIDYPSYDEIYARFKKLPNKEKRDLIENHVLPSKVKEGEKSWDDPTKKSSFESFVEEVNKYVFSTK